MSKTKVLLSYLIPTLRPSGPCRGKGGPGTDSRAVTDVSRKCPGDPGLLSPSEGTGTGRESVTPCFMGESVVKEEKLSLILCSTLVICN